MEYPGRVIKKGEKNGEIVKAIQQQLNQRGMGPVDVDGDFGTNTETAVKEFQAQTRDILGHPLVVDGKLGPVSWSSLFVEAVKPVEPDGQLNALFSKVLEIAESQVGVLEDPPGSNRGPQVEQYLQSAGCSPGDPWCASFVYWCFKKASESLGVPNPLLRSGSCMFHWANTKGRKIGRLNATNDPSLIHPGFIFIMDHGGGKRSYRNC